jgi:hypothetical protein
MSVEFALFSIVAFLSLASLIFDLAGVSVTLEHDTFVNFSDFTIRNTTAVLVALLLVVRAYLSSRGFRQNSIIYWGLISSASAASAIAVIILVTGSLLAFSLLLPVVAYIILVQIIRFRRFGRRRVVVFGIGLRSPVVVILCYSSFFILVVFSLALGTDSLKVGEFYSKMKVNSAIDKYAEALDGRDPCIHGYLRILDSPFGFIYVYNTNYDLDCGLNEALSTQGARSVRNILFLSSLLSEERSGIFSQQSFWRAASLQLEVNEKLAEQGTAVIQLEDGWITVDLIENSIHLEKLRKDLAEQRDK